MKNIFILLLVLLSETAISQTVTVSFTPSQDNSIFSESFNFSNALGHNLYAGRTTGTAATENRRALVKFDVSSLPANAQIQSASLSMAVLQSSNNTTATHNYSLHNLLKTWGEGTSNTPSGQGTQATTNDATWQYNLYNSSSWTTLGGDFFATPSATSGVAFAQFPLQYGTWTSENMKNDVISWKNSPSTNFGWIVIGEENTLGSAKRFASREETFFPKPTLTITYTLPPIDKVYINEVNPNKKWFELYNPSKPVVNLSNYWLTNGNLSEAINGGNVIVLNGNLQLDSAQYAVLSWAGLGQSDGELALFNQNPTNNAAIMKDYLQYGSANHQKAVMAVTAQVWDNATNFLPTITADTLTYSTNPNNPYASGQATNSTTFLVQRQTPTFKNDICPTSLTLSGSLVEANYQSSGQIISTGNVSSSSKIKVNSPQSVILNNLFNVASGAVFEVKIRGCIN